MKEGDLARFGIQKEQKPHGAGGEKVLHDDPEHPDRVLAFQLAEVKESDQYKVKTRYYLAKLAHLIFPDNVPDIHFSYSDPNATSRDKVSLDKDHDVVRRYNLEKRDYAPRSEASDTYKRHLRSLEENEDIQAFSQALHEAGFSADPEKINFGLNERGVPQYVDSFNYPEETSTQRLEAAISTRFEGHERERALELLERLKRVMYEGGMESYRRDREGPPEEFSRFEFDQISLKREEDHETERGSYRLMRKEYRGSAKAAFGSHFGMGGKEIKIAVNDVVLKEPPSENLNISLEIEGSEFQATIFIDYSREPAVVKIEFQNDSFPEELRRAAYEKAIKYIKTLARDRDKDLLHEVHKSEFENTDWPAVTDILKKREYEKVDAEHYVKAYSGSVDRKR
jgi:hypothetical protein